MNPPTDDGAILPALRNCEVILSHQLAQFAGFSVWTQSGVRSGHSVAIALRLPKTMLALTNVIGRSVPPELRLVEQAHALKWNAPAKARLFQLGLVMNQFDWA